MAHRRQGAGCGMSQTRWLPQRANCTLHGPGRDEHRRAFAGAGQIISNSRPTTPEVNADLEVDKALQDLFAVQTAPDRKGCLDIERFIAAQDALAKALGDESDRVLATAAFLDVSACQRKGTLNSFSCWQRERLESRGMSTRGMVEVLRRVTNDVKQCFKGKGGCLQKTNRTSSRLEEPRTLAQQMTILTKDVPSIVVADNLPAQQKTTPQARADREFQERGSEKNSVASSTNGCAILEASKRRTSQDQSHVDVRKDISSSKPGKPSEPSIKHKEEKAERLSKQLPCRLSELGKPAQPVPKENEQIADRLPKEGHDNRTSAGFYHMDSIGTRLYSEAKFIELAEYARQTPKMHTTSVPELVRYLVNGVPSDDATKTPHMGPLVKAWAIFSWVCHHIAYDVDGLHGRAPKQSCAPDDVLKSRLSVCAGYASVFEALAKHAGLTVKQVCGHARNCSRRVGQDVIKDNVGAHAWNAVQCGGEWILVDCTWGAGTCTNTAFERGFRPHFFGVPPNQLAFTHFSSDPSWQLISYSVFINQPIVCTDVFFGHNLRFFSPTQTGVIKLRGSSEGSVTLDVPTDFSVMGKLGAADCRQKKSCPSGRSLTLQFSLPGGSKKEDLEIFVRRGGPYGSYCFACRLVVERL